MTHYICTGGCGGMSEKPGMCKAEDCPLFAEELEECNCPDGTHEARKGEMEETEEVEE